MRTLRFIVDDQIIKLDPSCDFSNLVPGSEGYIQAEFVFSHEWNGCTKVAGFSNSFSGKEYPPQVLRDGRTCRIPLEATKREKFKVWVIGKKEGLKISTNKVEVIQNGGRN